MADRSSGERDQPGSRTVERAIDCLFALAKHPAGLTNLEVSAALQLDKSTTHRLLITLERRGLVRRSHPARKFLLGSAIYEMAVGSMTNPHLTFRPLLHRLVTITGETSSLSLLGDRTWVCIDHVQSPHELRFAPEIGRPYPLNAGATGKAMLAFLDPADVADILSGNLVVFTSNTVADPDRLRAELDVVRSRGYAISAGERIAGGASISCPIFRAGGRILGAITISAVASRCPPEKLHRYYPQLHRFAAIISSQFGHTAPTERNGSDA